ncbi:MAG: magnesium-translocating P-type ATPase [archaeon]|nr:magnesium-translocating P-type ATPase [archaeon]
MANGSLTPEERMKFATSAECADVIEEFGSRPEGLTQEEVSAARVQYGRNTVTNKDKHRALRRFYRAFCNVFALALFCYAFLDDILCGLDVENDGTIFGIMYSGFMDDYIFITIITSLILISGAVSFIQETRNTRIADKLVSMVSTTITVIRDGEEAEIDSRDLVVGDIIIMDTGDTVPADVRILESNHLKIDQAALTGESAEVTKTNDTDSPSKSILECENIAFMGTSVVGGSAKAIVSNVGNDTIFGAMADKLSGKRPKTAYDVGTKKVVKLLLTIMVCMIPPVLVIMIARDPTYDGVFDAIKYAIALAVGLMPEMLSTIVTANLAKGAIEMSKKKVIVKDMTSLQNFGAMDVLCSDKTGTLTQNKISVKSCCDIFGNNSTTVALYSSLNSSNLTSSTNQIDWAIDEFAGEKEELVKEMKGYEFVNDLPFDFIRRRATVVVKRTEDNIDFVISKGAIQEMLSISTGYLDENRDIQPIDDKITNDILGLAEWYSTKGMRVLGVCYKPIADGTNFGPADESELIIAGLIVFMDPVKESAADAIKDMKDYGIQVKVLTGDNEFVTKYVCEEIDLATSEVYVGTQIDAMSDEELQEAVETCNVFARLTPDNKARIVTALRAKGHTVGLLGDGINDSVAMRQADVGISVDTGADIAKESADLILLEKDLGVLKQGAIQGRCVYCNTSKYVKMIGGINFGYMFSLIMATLLFDFEPIGPMQILIFNLINDIACMFIAWDNVEDEYVREPKNWDTTNLRTVFVAYGPMCCVTDIISWVFFAFVVIPMFCAGVDSGWDVITGGFVTDVESKLEAMSVEQAEQSLAAVAAFETCWCVEQYWMQVWAIHIVRNNKIPFLQSWSAPILVATTLIALAFGTLFPFTPIGQIEDIGLVAIPWYALVFMPFIGLTYFIIANLAKKRCLRKHGYFAC